MVSRGARRGGVVFIIVSFLGSAPSAAGVVPGERRGDGVAGPGVSWVRQVSG
jgi:hypothetical protein